MLTGISGLILSCSPGKITSGYYYQHQQELDRIEANYKELNNRHPFTIAFTDRAYQALSLSILTDSLRYIYSFTAGERRLTDTLQAYRFDTAGVNKLIGQMQAVRCAWINKLDYYIDDKKHTLILLSVKPVAVSLPFTYKKYYTLGYFPETQYYDSSGQLLDKRKSVRLRKISGKLFSRINTRVGYTVSGNFR